MKAIYLILTMMLCKSSLQIFNASADIEFNAGINYQSLLSQRQTEWRRREADLNAKINDLESKLSIAQGAISILESDKAGLQNDNEILAEELAKCQLKLVIIGKKESQINSLSINLSQCEDDKNALQASIDELSASISSIVSENESLKAELDSRDRDLASFEVQIVNWELELNSCQSEINQKNELLLQLEQSQKDGDALNEALKQLNITIEVNEEKNTQLQVENNELKLVIDGLNADIEKLSALPNIIINLEADIANLESSNAQLIEDANSLSVTLTNLQIDCQKQGDEQNEEIEKLTVQLQLAEEANKRSNDQISELSIIIQGLEGSQLAVDELTVIVNNLNAQLNAASDDNNQLRDEISRLNGLLAEMDSIKEQNSILSVEINNLSVQITEINQSISLCQQDNATLKSLNQKLGNDMKVLTGELDLKQFASDGSTLLIGNSGSIDY